MTALPSGTATAEQARRIDGVVGLAVFLGATAMLFVAALFAYAVLRAQAPAWPPPGTPAFPRGAAGANGLLLIAGGLALRTARPRAAALLGAAFLALQGVLWRRLVGAHLGPGAGPLGDAFFALSMLHALHVVGGLVALAVTRARRLRLLTIYWDFVALVWVVIYLAVCVL